ncbi:hypothetical protein RvY_16115 [Ramazzottius varieornatus]|uniref:General transcription factor IIF subunit 2 n=1 Tax=Ramazzottius varieornatus TaxID=947166 RepID=A0A1D1VXB3_RAMVA|nr:hypothetical protein RvY_16115 [Ramazzottius varieornatus]
MAQQPTLSATPSTQEAPGQKLDCSNSTRPVWLIKVPKYLGVAFEKAAREDIGQLSIAKDAADPSKLSIVLKIKEGALEKDVPLEYEVPLVQFTSQKMAVLVKNNTDASGSAPGSLVMDGFVNRRADIRPLGAGGDKYMKMKQEQIKKAQTPVRTALLYDKVVNNFKPTMNNQLKRKGRGEEKEAKPEKRLREDREVVVERIMTAFEKHQYYTMPDLAEITKQPVGFLKEVLKEYCEYVSKGEHKSTYQLKPEYRTH